MTRKEAIYNLEYCKSQLFDVDKDEYVDEELREALDMAIEALGREPFDLWINSMKPELVRKFLEE